MIYGVSMDIEINSYTGNKIRIARMKKSLSLASLSSKIGLSPALLHKYESGKCNISIKNLKVIADIFNEDISFFLPKKDN